MNLLKEGVLRAGFALAALLPGSKEPLCGSGGVPLEQVATPPGVAVCLEDGALKVIGSEPGDTLFINTSAFCTPVPDFAECIKKTRKAVRDAEGDGSMSTDGVTGIIEDIGDGISVDLGQEGDLGKGTVVFEAAAEAREAEFQTPIPEAGLKVQPSGAKATIHCPEPQTGCGLTKKELARVRKIVDKAYGIVAYDNVLHLYGMYGLEEREVDHKTIEAICKIAESVTGVKGCHGAARVLKTGETASEVIMLRWPKNDIDMAAAANRLASVLGLVDENGEVDTSRVLESPGLAPQTISPDYSLEQMNGEITDYLLVGLVGGGALVLSGLITALSRRSSTGTPVQSRQVPNGSRIQTETFDQFIIPDYDYNEGKPKDVPPVSAGPTERHASPGYALPPANPNMWDEERIARIREFVARVVTDEYGYPAHPLAEVAREFLREAENARSGAGTSGPVIIDGVLGEVIEEKEIEGNIAPKSVK